MSDAPPPFPSAAPVQDPTAAGRKEDHIELAFRSQIAGATLDQRFDYEPMLAAHPIPGSLPATPFGGKSLRAPLWVSSMTGGTEKALTINHNLARACREFGIGMGLGSCRSLLYDDARLPDFNVRPLTGPDVPLFGNLGVAQVEELLRDGEVQMIHQLVTLLDLDGLIIHVNPLQEWLQPEGDRFRESPLAVVKATLEALAGRVPLIVKEVGQGFGPASLRELLRLPLLALDTAAGGGTNFSQLELLRSDEVSRRAFAPLANVGHSVFEMRAMLDRLITELGSEVRCQSVIFSGGVKSFLEGYWLMEGCQLPAIYGQASAFLRYARADYGELRQFVETQVRGLELARAYLRPRYE